jgi:hypothetical protein
VQLGVPGIFPTDQATTKYSGWQVQPCCTYNVQCAPVPTNGACLVLQSMLHYVRRGLQLRTLHVGCKESGLRGIAAKSENRLLGMRSRRAGSARGQRTAHAHAGP